MTMNDLKPSAIIEFNKHIADEFAREYFADTFDLWAESESKYDDTDNGYKVIIKRHIGGIQAAIKQADIFLKSEYTKRVSALNNGFTYATGTKDSAENRTKTDGEFTQQARSYPDGYIDAPDAAYIKAETHDSEFTQTDVGAIIESQENDTTSSTTADTEEADILSLADRLTAYKPAYALIEQCVFDLTANDITGRF